MLAFQYFDSYDYWIHVIGFRYSHFWCFNRAPKVSPRKVANKRKKPAEDANINIEAPAPTTFVPKVSELPSGGTRYSIVAVSEGQTYAPHLDDISQENPAIEPSEDAALTGMNVLSLSFFDMLKIWILSAFNS